MQLEQFLRKSNRFLLLALSVAVTAPSCWAQANVLTQHNDNARTGANLSETTLNTSNVNPTQFGKLFSCPVDGQIYAQPLVVSNVAIPSQGTHNVVYVATMHNSVYGFDANNGAQLWHINLGPSIPQADVQAVPDIQIEIGILSAPVVDTATNTMYVVSRNENPVGTFTQWLNAIDITTGAQKFSGPKQIAGQYPGSGDGSVAGQVIFNSKTANQRPALLLNNGIVYIGWASHNDQGPYHGWVMGYDAATLAQKSVFNTSPNVSSDGVWQAGNGLAADSTGSVYFLTGNGPSSNGANGTFGEAFLKLGVNADKTTSVLDWFEPFDLSTLDSNDADISAGGGMILPGTSLLVGGGKSGKIYVLNTANMGHFQSGSDSQIHQWWQAASGHLHSGEIYWNSPSFGPSIYCWSEYDHLKQFQFNTGTQLFNTTPVGQSTMPVPGGMPGGMISISANGSTAGTGIVWGSHASGADASYNTVPGILQAFDANNLSNELWNSTMVASRDDRGLFPKDCAPTVANGHLYAASNSNRLDVYGLLATPGIRVPGQIEAEYYNPGGEGVGYHDATTGNANGTYGPGYRFDNVDITTSADPDSNPSTLGPLVVNHFDSGEWLKYNVNVAAAGTYNCQFRTAGGFTGEGFHLEVDGTNVTGTVTVPNTGNWTTFATTTSGTFSLTAGQHTLRLVADTGGADINYMVLNSTSTSPPVVTSAGTASGTVGSAFSYQITATNSPTSYGASSLPAGVSVNTGNGLVSGTPTTAGTSNSTITATNAGGTGSGTVTITINPATPPAPVITSAGSASGTVGSAFTYQITASNSPTSYGASSLPAGTSVNTGNGLISGTPTTAATNNSSVTATNAGGTGSKAVTITISPSGGATPFNINAFFTLGTTVTNGGADNGGNAYESNLLGTTATYNGSTFTFGPANSVDAWNNVTVNLPAGTYTTLNMLGSAVQGNVTAQTFTVHYTDGTTSVFTQNMHDWENNGSYTGETLVVTMANHLNSAGAATAPACYVHGYTFALNGKAVQSITLPTSRQVLAFGFAAGGAVSAPVINSALTKSGTVGSALTYNITATNSPTSYNATSLPAGLSVNTGTGLISGTPTTAGTTNTTISATNAGGTGSATLVITINGTTTAFNIFAIFTAGTAPTNGGADNGSNAYDSNLLGTTATFNSSSFTYGAANVANAWNNTTVNLPPGTYTTLNMIGTAVQGNVTAQTFTVHYTDGTTSTFTQNMHDWKSSGAYTGETTVSTQANQIISTGAATTPATYVHGYTFTLSGHSVQSITLPATRQVLAFGFAGR